LCRARHAFQPPVGLSMWLPTQHHPVSMWLPILIAVPPCIAALKDMDVPRVVAAEFKDAESFMRTYFAQNSPVILTNATGEWLHLLDMSWHDGITGGHTVRPLDSQYAQSYKAAAKFPWSSAVMWHMSSVWGGTPGFLKNGAGAHVDRSCNYFFGLQARGRKRWYVYRPDSASQYRLGKVFQSNTRYTATVNPGEIFLWPPWLTHATEIVDDKAFSINGDIKLFNSTLQEDVLLGSFPQPCRKRNDERKLLSKWMSGEEVEADLKDEL